VDFPAVLCRISRLSDAAWPRSGGAKMLSRGHRVNAATAAPGLDASANRAKETPVPYRRSLRLATDPHLCDPLVRIVPENR
jgi:hypothetical protein